MIKNLENKMDKMQESINKNLQELKNKHVETTKLLKFKVHWKESWRRQWHPTPVLLPGESHGQRSLVGCSPWGLEESDTTEQLHFHFSSTAEYLKQKNESMSWKINRWKYLSEGPNKVKRMKRTEDSLRDLWDHVKHTNVRIIGVPEEEWQPTPVF